MLQAGGYAGEIGMPGCRQPGSGAALVASSAAWRRWPRPPVSLGCTPELAAPAERAEAHQIADLARRGDPRDGRRPLERSGPVRFPGARRTRHDVDLPTDGRRSFPRPWLPPPA